MRNLLDDDEQQADEPQANSLMHSLKTIPAAVLERVIQHQMRQQYQQALEALLAIMRDPHRERKQVWQHITQLETSGLPARQHIPTLAELEQVARKAGGTAYVEVEQTVFKEMARLSHPDLVPFLLQAFEYRRKHDQFAGRRREYSVDITATIAARTGDSRAIAALGKMLDDPTPKIRGVALVVIYETYEREGCEMQPALLEHFWRLGRGDPDLRVRQTALAFLQRLGQVGYAEAIEYLRPS